MWATCGLWMWPSAACGKSLRTTLPPQVYPDQAGMGYLFGSQPG